MSSEDPSFPPPLASTDDATALLIQRALREPQPGPSEEQSWARLEARGSRRPLRAWLPVGAALAVAAGFWLWWAKPNDHVALTAEHFPPPQAAQEHPGSIGPSDAPVVPSAAPPAHAKAPLPRSSAGEEDDTARCAKLAQNGHYDDAASCYGSIARGSSMAAELALYEKARILAKAQGKSQEALATLNEHPRRFPGGLLASEVALTRIELLNQLGRRDEALRAIDQALGGTLGRERGGDLQLLRAELLAAQGDCAHALDAITAAKSRGVHPSRVEAIEKRCSGSGEQ
ncbi:MAG TPA: tetratricopeptide repeat protein [Polyangiaceae bacterium]|nr:tetratricopeptide repeat protein [Polyangiaceae bacterium]